MNPTNFRMFCPDESNSNRLNSIFEATKRCSMAEIVSIDDELGPDGRVMEVLSEHLCQGWLEGYTQQADRRRARGDLIITSKWHTRLYYSSANAWGGLRPPQVERCRYFPPIPNTCPYIQFVGRIMRVNSTE